MLRVGSKVEEDKASAEDKSRVKEISQEFRKAGQHQLRIDRAKCGSAFLVLGMSPMVAGVILTMQANAWLAQADAMPMFIPNPNYNPYDAGDPTNPAQIGNAARDHLWQKAEQLGPGAGFLIALACVVIVVTVALYIGSNRGQPELNSAQAIDKFLGAKGESVELTTPGQKKDEGEGGEEQESGAHM